MTSTRSDVTEWDFPNPATPVGSAVYYAVRFSPAPLRRRNAMLFGWYQLVQDVAAHARDPGAARLKLDWWRQEVALIPQGQARHPLGIALQQIGLDDSSAAVMSAMIDTADEEIRVGSLTDNAAFSTFCRGGLGKLFLLLARLEDEKGISAETCLDLGTYCAAVERVRRLVESPHRVPVAISPQALKRLSAAERLELIETLIGTPRGTGAADLGRVPDFVARMTALSRALHSKMRQQGYPAGDTPVDRAPIAHLWTAWRCRY